MALGLTIAPVNIEPPITNPAIVDSSALIAPRSAEAHYDPTLGIKAQIRAIGASSTPSTVEIALAVAEAESGFKNVEGVTGDMGIFQFSPDTWEDVCEGDPYNIEANIRCGISMISDNQLWRWSASREDRKSYTGWFSRLSTSTKRFVLRQDELCSCVVYASRYMKLPKIQSPSDLKPNTNPFIGSAVLLDYTIGGSHIAIVTKITGSGFLIREANFNRCKESFRFIKWEDHHIRGFFNL